MYEAFFGLKEKPFKLVPNPEYLFLSRSHEEALAHLTYATSEGDGFVEITGEVGTGKTTLCRAFLESLGKQTETAFIFNPRLDAIQMLQSINCEFGIPAESTRIKDLIDILNAFLLTKKAQQRRVILLIDEAQSLTPDTLEMLRMLSNLETTQSKLLQIIMVGQPELSDMLDTPELRQLGQRITLKCHLLPMTFKETCNYIQHRINVASQKQCVLFSWTALRIIYRHAGGIPRLINIACDRSLLAAYSLNRLKVSGAIARAALRELAGRSYHYSPRRAFGKQVLAGLAVVGLILGGMVGLPALRSKLADRSASIPAAVDTLPARAEQTLAEKPPAVFKVPPAPEAEPVAAAAPAPPPQTPDIWPLQNYLDENQPLTTRMAAVRVTLGRWLDRPNVEAYVDNVEADDDFLGILARHNGLAVARVDGGLDMLQGLNLPALVLFHAPQGQDPAYLTLTRIEGDTWIFSGAEEPPAIIEAGKTQVAQLFTGVAYVLWKNFLDCPGVIPSSAPKSAVVTLKTLLQDIGFTYIAVNDFYDEQTRLAVREIQAKYGLPPDGRVGPLTKIVLYNEKNAWDIPHLKE
jgi:general secretion pathway protein A